MYCFVVPFRSLSDQCGTSSDFPILSTCPDYPLVLPCGVSRAPRQMLLIIDWLIGGNHRTSCGKNKVFRPFNPALGGCQHSTSGSSAFLFLKNDAILPFHHPKVRVNVGHYSGGPPKCWWQPQCRQNRRFLWLPGGIISPRTSITSAPVFSVKKKDFGSWLCVDYCKPKSVNQNNCYPTPSTTHLVKIFSVSTIFHKI